MPTILAKTEIGEQRKLYLGIAHRNVQQFSEAERDFREADAIARSLAPGFRYQVLIAKGDLHVDREDYVEAESSYKSALGLAKHQKLPAIFEANALGNLGRLAIRQQHFAEAIDINQTALELTRSLGMQGHVATILGNMGSSYFQLGDFENALDLFQKSADASKKSGLVGNTTYWFTGVANSYTALHDYASAESVATTTLKEAREEDDARSITLCLHTLAELALRDGRFEEAERYNTEAVALEEKGVDLFGVLQSLLISGRVEISKRHFERAEALFRRIMEDPKAEIAMRWEANARMAELHAAEGLVTRAAREYQASIDTIQKAQESIDRMDLRLTYLASGIEFYDDYLDFLIRNKRPHDALHVAELSRSRTQAEGLASDVSPFPAGNLRPQEIARKLKATLLFYWLGHNRSYLWVIGPAKTALFKLPKAAEIEPLVKSYRRALPDVDDALDTSASDGKKLYAMLVEPAKELIPPGSRVILLPAESLYGLNFETLIVSDPTPHFWIEDVTLTTASSLTLLDASLRRPATTGKDLLLIGNVLPTTGFPALSQAATEMQKVEHYFPQPNRKVLEGKQATPTAYLDSNPEKYAYLHFVTHGTASRARPLESAVVLSPEGDSYKLYARDVVTHHLDAQLVTISACDTSGKRTISGEGLVGLSWAFLRAGAHKVIGALWEVSDVSTPQLMDSLYDELTRGKEPAAALRDAKLKMLDSPDANSVFKKPFYWAPFQLYAGS